MNYGQKVKKQQYREIWEEYCSFLDLSIEEYMEIQKRLLEEQISVWSASGLGQMFLKGRQPQTIEDFRRTVPLTTYGDYADILLAKKTDMLPGEPVIWLQTTWEGGKHPVKVAPYTRSMLDVFRSNLMAITTLSSSNETKKARLKNGDKVLFGLAPLPFVTWLFPVVFEEEIDFKFLPPVKEAHSMSFGERNKKGFSLGMQKGIDLFFGLSSVAFYITENFASSFQGGASGGMLKKAVKMKPLMLYRFLKAKYQCAKEGRDIEPRDLFSLKSLVCAGTDTASYKDALREAWGIDPLEIFAGTEVSIVGTETHSRNGMVFFPDSCFYEFIPEDEVYKSMDDPSYQPLTILMDELVANQNYELVVTVLKGGAFARYRIGDMFRCVSTGGDKSTNLPQLVFLDRVPWVIDIAGFTRITENSIEDVIRLSGLSIKHWIAKKEYDTKRRPYLHIYVELNPADLGRMAVSTQILKEHLEVYFTFFDTDYRDLKKMLGIEPLQITVLKCGTMEQYQELTGKKLRRVNPSSFELSEFLKFDTYQINGDRRYGR